MKKILWYLLYQDVANNYSKDTLVYRYIRFKFYKSRKSGKL